MHHVLSIDVHNTQLEDGVEESKDTDSLLPSAKETRSLPVYLYHQLRRKYQGVC